MDVGTDGSPNDSIASLIMNHIESSMRTLIDAAVEERVRKPGKSHQQPTPNDKKFIILEKIIEEERMKLEQQRSDLDMAQSALARREFDMAQRELAMAQSVTPQLAIAEREVEQPAMAQPTIAQPEVEQPTIAQREVEQPSMAQSDDRWTRREFDMATARTRRWLNPWRHNSTIAEREVEQPAMAQPTIAEPEVEQLAMAQPTIAEPEVEQLAMAQTTIAEPEVEQLAMAQLTNAQPPMVQHELEKQATERWFVRYHPRYFSIVSTGRLYRICTYMSLNGIFVFRRHTGQHDAAHVEMAPPWLTQIAPLLGFLFVSAHHAAFFCLFLSIPLGKQ